MKIPDFNDKLLLLTALTHRSAINEHATAARESNERLEYLGDAVLELATTEFLYTQLPDAPEGKLTAIRSTLVKTTTLADVARELGLGEMLYLSHGEEASGGRENDALLADTMEAVLGALYLDGGFPKARDFVYEAILNQFEEIMENHAYKDAKSLFQELVQALGYETPIYEVAEAVGPDHDKHFRVRVSIGPYVVAEGEARNKQLAQQEAAEIALERLENDELVSKVMAAAEDFYNGKLESGTDESMLTIAVSPRKSWEEVDRDGLTTEQKLEILAKCVRDREENANNMIQKAQELAKKTAKKAENELESDKIHENNANLPVQNGE